MTLPARHPGRYPGDDIPIIRGSALCALKGEKPELGKASILKLMQVRRIIIIKGKRA